MVSIHYILVNIIEDRDLCQVVEEGSLEDELREIIEYSGDIEAVTYQKYGIFFGGILSPNLLS